MERLEKINKRYREVHSYLEDLSHLNGCDPIVLEQIKTRIFEFKDELIQERKMGGDDYHTLGKYFAQFFQNEIERFMLDHDRIRQIQYRINPQEISFASWDFYLSCIRSIFELTNLFDFCDPIEISVKDHALQMSGLFERKKWESQEKQYVYKLTKALLKKKVLLTYHIRDRLIDGKTYYQVMLILDLSDKKPFKTYIEGQRTGVDFIVSGALESYLVHPDNLSEISKHLCIEVNEDYEISRRKTLPNRCVESILKDNSNYSVFYFPFLFRPLSLIIPGSCTRVDEGAVERISQLLCAHSFPNDTGSENVSDERRSKNRQVYKIDFFSLFEK